jgi:hypothetical protein
VPEQVGLGPVETILDGAGDVMDAPLDGSRSAGPRHQRFAWIVRCQS